jgi:hypothetical protein
MDPDACHDLNPLQTYLLFEFGCETLPLIEFRRTSSVEKGRGRRDSLKTWGHKAVYSRTWNQWYREAVSTAKGKWLKALLLAVEQLEGSQK